MVWQGPGWQLPVLLPPGATLSWAKACGANANMATPNADNSPRARKNAELIRKSFSRIVDGKPQRVLARSKMPASTRKIP
jgi:hypothetical protein